MKRIANKQTITIIFPKRNEMSKINNFLENYNKLTNKGTCKTCGKEVQWNRIKLESHKRANCPEISAEERDLFAKKSSLKNSTPSNPSLTPAMKITSKVSQTLDTFDEGTCSVCAACEINQHFNMDESYVDYKGTFYSLREVLKDALDLQVRIIYLPDSTRY